MNTRSQCWCEKHRNGDLLPYVPFLHNLTANSVLLQLPVVTLWRINDFWLGKCFSHKDFSGIELLLRRSWIDGKSSLMAAVWPHEDYLCLLLAQGSALVTLFKTFGKKCLIAGVCRWLMAWARTLRLLKKTLSGVGRICESTSVCAGTQVLPCLPFHPADEILLVYGLYWLCLEENKKRHHRAVVCGLWGSKGWRRDSVAEKGRGSTGRWHCPVILGYVFLGRTNLLNVRAFLSTFTCCFWVSRCTWICDYEFTLLFLCSITSCSLNCWAVSALWRTQRLRVWGVTQPVVLCLSRWWQGGLSNYFTNKKLKPMKMKPFDKGCVGEKGQSCIKCKYNSWSGVLVTGSLIFMSP